ncbi:hypothetical protein EDEG_01169 [Edhazardia aedis USNM 41457]|uniref:Uncharacterized protein n=1 Tax=Edhazardia aedis (strain USNM 41457) TaxID=1003232 RepID=J9DTN4_EDHAE|nr:hypothetical protein EDEG_01169 [Edhazardia aedis USNM 41457]|eukprot:EJW04642.1 hypothetical protein EDEG_01169 [Edhazardia aedis USNM 41457]
MNKLIFPRGIYLINDMHERKDLVYIINLPINLFFIFESIPYILNCNENKKVLQCRCVKNTQREFIVKNFKNEIYCVFMFASWSIQFFLMMQHTFNFINKLLIIVYFLFYNKILEVIFKTKYYK